jgi:gamma-glutamyltranspeptidase/glutathione hydrolase
VSQRAAGASDARVVEAAREVLARGTAVDAVVAGVLVAAAVSPGVLLGPLQLLVGGAGAGLLTVDGRVRQPGLGVPRPRGALSGQAVPPQARVGVPAIPATLATVLASSGSATLLRAAGPALEAVRALSPERARVLEAVARRGAAALGQDVFATELLAVAGRAAGGTLTREDLASVRPIIASCAEGSLERGFLVLPGRAQPGLDASTTQVIAAVDARGQAAAACYEAPLEGLDVPALGLIAPLFAAPVMRGEPRVRPGEARPAPAPIALRAVGGRIDLALGVGQAAEAERALDAVIDALDGGPLVAQALAAAPAGKAIAVVRTRDAVRVIASG